MIVACTVVTDNIITGTIDNVKYGYGVKINYFGFSNNRLNGKNITYSFILLDLNNKRKHKNTMMFLL